MRSLTFATAALASALCVSCGPPPVSIPTYLGGELSRIPEPWPLVLGALDEADAAYHLIADTPIDEMEERSEEIGQRVTRARDLWRRAKTYDLRNIEFPCDVPMGTVSHNGQRNFYATTVRVPIEGHTVLFEAEVGAEHGHHGALTVRPVVSSTRGKTVARLYCASSPRPLVGYTSPASDDLDVGALAFGPILSSDGVSIPDLIVTIKR